MNLIVNATCIITDRNTGIERFAAHTCKELCRIDSTVTVVSSATISCLDSTHVPRILQTSKELLGQKEYYFRALWDQTLFRSFIASHKADIVFFPIQDGMIFPPIKQIVTMHDLHYLHFDTNVSECKSEIPQHRKWLYRYKMPHILKRSAAIVAVSEATKKDVVATFGIDPDKVHVIYNGYDDARFRVVDDHHSVLSRYGLHAGEYFLFVGSILRHKNVARLVRAFAKLNSKSKVVIAGACKDKDYLVEILRLVDEFQVPRENFLYLEYVSDDDLPYLYNGATALVLPSLHEGFGVPIIEAMACGAPVITSNCSSMPEVAGNAALLVDPYSVDSISMAMREILGNPRLITKLRNDGLERSRSFKWSSSAQKLYDLCHMVSEA